MVPRFVGERAAAKKGGKVVEAAGVGVLTVQTVGVVVSAGNVASAIEVILQRIEGVHVQVVTTRQRQRARGKHMKDASGSMSPVETTESTAREPVGDDHVRERATCVCHCEKTVRRGRM